MPELSGFVDATTGESIVIILWENTLNLGHSCKPCLIWFTFYQDGNKQTKNVLKMASEKSFKKLSFSTT